MNIRNRIKEYRVISPDDVKPNPRNWRTHPQAQRDALRGILAELVYDSARHGGLTLIDGHERMTVGVPFPALILDVTDEEADKLLATFDPISAMAETNAATLSDLLRDVSTDNAALAQMLIPLMRGQVAAHAEPLATIRAQKRQRMAFAAQLGGAAWDWQAVGRVGLVALLGAGLSMLGAESYKAQLVNRLTDARARQLAAARDTAARQN